MSRFEIEDIVSQDKRGIVFRAHDSENGHTVALRRFFPFGQDGGGLKEEESVAFRIAAQRLVGLTHPALRSVFSGAVDPIDIMPYIVAEWVEGARLDEVLNGKNLDPRLVIQLLRLALEVSLSLSNILGEEAVWVETETDSIFVGSEETGRGFVFWLSPFKWLGAEFETRKLAAIVELGERLAGWKGKLIGDHAGSGLGGWLKWMKNNPEASLAQALESLPTFTAARDAPPMPKPTFPAPVASLPAVKMTPPSTTSPLLIAACICLLLALGGLAYSRMSAKAPVVPPLYSEQTISPPMANPTPDQAKAIQPEPAPQLAVSLAEEKAEELAREKEVQRAAALAPPTGNDFSPDDSEKMRELKANHSASVTGVVRHVRTSNSKKSLYFEFSSPLQPQQIHVVAHQKTFDGEFKVEAYASLIGKNLRFDGTVFREPRGRQYVKITTAPKISEGE